MRFPNFCLILLTNKCNLRCKICGLWREKTKSIDSLYFPKIIKLLKRYNISSVAISGGESLLEYKKLIALMRLLKKNGIKRISLSTNGLLLNKRNILEMQSLGLNELYISIDGLEKTHNFLRGRETYKKILENIKMINRLRLKNKSKLNLVINITLHRRNYKEAASLIKKASELKVDMVDIQPILIIKGSFGLTGKDVQKIKDYYSIPKKELEDLREVLTEIIKLKKKYGGFIGNTITHLNSIYSYFKNGFNSSFPCKSYEDILIIDYYLNVRACPFLPYISGNLKDMKINLRKDKEDIENCGKCLAFCTHPDFGVLP